MKKHLEKKREADLLKQYPIKGRAEGWYFRLKETSNNAWAVEGVDVWGRRVYFSGGDPEALLADAETESERILAGVGGG